MLPQAQRQTRTREERQETWEARAVQLAEARHLVGVAHLLERGIMRWFYALPRRGPGHYIVIEHRVHHSVRCDCSAGARSYPCGHAGAVLHAIHQREAAIADPDQDPLASWRRGLE